METVFFDQSYVFAKPLLELAENSLQRESLLLLVDKQSSCKYKQFFPYFSETPTRLSPLQADKKL